MPKTKLDTTLPPDPNPSRRGECWYGKPVNQWAAPDLIAFAGLAGIDAADAEEYYATADPADWQRYCREHVTAARSREQKATNDWFGQIRAAIENGNKRAAVQWLERVGSWPSSDPDVAALTRAAERLAFR